MVTISIPILIFAIATVALLLYLLYIAEGWIQIVVVCLLATVTVRGVYEFGIELVEFLQRLWSYG